MSKMIELNENKLELKKMINNTIYDYLEYMTYNNTLSNEEINQIIYNTLVELQNNKYLQE